MHLQENKYVPDETDTLQILQQQGWTFQKIGVPTTINVHNIKQGIRGTRRQYGLQHHVGNTIHATMGATLKSLVTRVEPSGDCQLWLPSQVVVLLSRTKHAKDTCFISKNKYQTANTLFDLLKQTTPFRTYINYLLDTLTSPSTNTPTTYHIVDQSKHIFCPSTVPIPNDNSCTAYIIASRTNYKYLYIGSARNLRERFHKHNAGFGSQQTTPFALRPYALLAYVAGFDGKYADARLFENNWIQAKLRYMNNRNIHHSVEGIINLASNVIQEFPHDHNLRLIHCGTLQKIKARMNNQS